MPTKQEAALMLTLSNLAYLLPVFVIIFKATPLVSTDNRVPLRIAIPLIFLLFFIGIVVSWGYHNCSSDLAIQAGQDLSQFDPLVADSCSTCKPTWHSAMTWSGHTPVNILHFLDVTVTMFIMFVFFSYLVPIRSEVRHISTLFAFMWVFYFTALQMQYVAAIPILLVSVFFFVYWYYHRHESKTRNIMWSIGVASTIVAFFFYITELPNYFIGHQLWHIMGGLSAAAFSFCIATKAADKFPDHPFWSWLFRVEPRSETLHHNDHRDMRSNKHADLNYQIINL